MGGYHTVISLLFPVTAEQLYAELTNLNRHHLWNSGLSEISHKGEMEEGLEYTTKTRVVGREITNTNRVLRLLPYESIELESKGGAISYVITYHLDTALNNETQLTCEIRFEFDSFALKLGHSVIESMAKAHLQGDLESLRALLSGSNS